MSPLFPRLHSLFNPDQFQGVGKEQHYFEGWYFKLINSDLTVAYAIIPGIAMDGDGKRQAFIQVLDGIRETAIYHKFDFESFTYSDKEFSISIGSNSFSVN